MLLREFDSKTKPKALFLIGVPGSGKSTFRATLPKDFVILSTDDVFDRLAKEHGMTYTQAFHKLGFKIPQAEFDAAFQEAIANNRNIVIDQTNMSVAARAKKLRLIPDHYWKVRRYGKRR